MSGGDIALIIGAIIAGTVTLGTFIMTVITWRDAREIKAAGAARDTKLVELHDLVNGKSEELKSAVKQIAFTAGVKVGADAERENPTTTVPK